MEKVKKKMNMLIVGYVSVSILYQIFWLIAPLRGFLFDSGLNIVSSGLAMLGVVLFLWDLFTDRVFLRGKYVALLIASIAVLCVSSAFYVHYGVSKNAKVIIWQLVQMLVMYPLCHRIAAEYHAKYLKVMHGIVSCVFVPAVLISLYQYVFNISYNIIVDGNGCRQGFQEGRVFGVFASIYFASLLITLMMICSFYLASKTKNKLLRGLYIAEGVLFFAYIIQSGTRSIQVGLFLALFVFSFTLLKANKLINKKITMAALKYAVCVVLSVVSVLGGIVVFDTVDNAMDIIPMSVFKEHSNSNNLEDKDHDGIPDDDSIMIDRPDLGENNISNHRFEIWKDYFNVTSDDILTVLFGHSPGSYMDVIKDENDDAFIVSYIKRGYPTLYEQGLIYDTHNSYLSIYVTTGLVGVVVMALFFFLCGRKVVMYIFRREKAGSAVLFMTLVVIVIMGSIFFDSDVFFKCTDTSMLLWVIAGFLMNRIDNEQKSADSDTETAAQKSTEPSTR